MQLVVREEGSDRVLGVARVIAEWIVACNLLGLWEKDLRGLREHMEDALLKTLVKVCE